MYCLPINVSFSIRLFINWANLVTQMCDIFMLHRVIRGYSLSSKKANRTMWIETRQGTSGNHGSNQQLFPLVERSSSVGLVDISASGPRNLDTNFRIGLNFKNVYYNINPEFDFHDNELIVASPKSQENGWVRHSEGRFLARLPRLEVQNQLIVRLVLITKNTALLMVPATSNPKKAFLLNKLHYAAKVSPGLVQWTLWNKKFT